MALNTTDSRRRLLTLVAVVVFVIGLWILNGACRFALSASPPADRVPEYRVVFYPRSGLGVGCILLGIVLLRLRPARPGDARDEVTGPDA